MKPNQTQPHQESRVWWRWDVLTPTLYQKGEEAVSIETKNRAKPYLPNPFKPSKLNVFSMLVSKVTAFLNHPLTVKQVKQLHALVLINGLHYLEPMVITQIISPPSNHSETTIHYIRSLVHHSKHPNVIARTSAIQFFYQHGQFQEALAEYIRMQRSGLLPTTSAVASILKACTRLGNRIGGIMIHAQVHGYGFCGDVHVGTALVGFYSKLNDMETAKRVCDEMSERNAISCVIDGYLESGNCFMAERLFSDMGNKDIASWNSMVSWYTRTGDMEKAKALFGLMPVKSSASWIAMIGGYVDSGNLEIARNFYDVMPEQNAISCIKMIDGYSNNGAVEFAREIFDEMGEKNHLLYNAMITCYAQNGRPKEALLLFDEMLQPNASIQPDTMTLATVISVASQLGYLTFGSWIHETLMKQMRIVMDDHLRAAFINLYAKCGCFDKAYGLFHGLAKKDVGVYTTMILACSRNGWKQTAINLFEEMLEANICPNLVTFSGVLTALNHRGMVEESYSGFTSAPRPLNHLGWVEEGYQPANSTRPHGFNSTSQLPPLNLERKVEESYSVTPTPPPRPLDHLGMVQQNYHGINSTNPLDHLGMVRQKYHGVNSTNPLLPSNHEGRFEESCHEVTHPPRPWNHEVHFNSTGPLPTPRPLNHLGWVEEGYQPANSTRLHGFNSTSQLPPLNLERKVEESYSVTPLPPPRPLDHLGMVQQNYHGVNSTNPLPPSNHEGRFEESCDEVTHPPRPWNHEVHFNSTGPLPTPRPLNHDFNSTPRTMTMMVGSQEITIELA